MKPCLNPYFEEIPWLWLWVFINKVDDYFCPKFQDFEYKRISCQKSIWRFLSEISGLLLWRVEPVGGSGLDGSLNFSRSQEVAPPGPQAPRPSVKVIEQHTIFSNFPTMRPPLTSLFVLLGPQSFYIIIFVGWVWIQVKVKAQETHFLCVCYTT